MNKLFIKGWIWAFVLLMINTHNGNAQSFSKHDLQFTTLATSWDAGIPLGNGILGALIWQKGTQLRFSLDRADLWDTRPMEGLNRTEFNYHWVFEQVKKKNYAVVQQYLDVPYEAEPAPSKIPGGALEFDTRSWGAVQSVRLAVKDAVCEVKWQQGTVLHTYIHATEPVGWFRFENLPADIQPALKAPAYQGKGGQKPGGSVAGDDLARLGYPEGKITSNGNTITYRQQGWNGFEYEIHVQWKKINATTLEGAWSISSHYPNKKAPAAAQVVENAMSGNYHAAFRLHGGWWQNYWSRSALAIPDTLIEKQWYLEQYKFGSAARKGAPVVTLQAIWTADNGRLPPWKGDVHNDLNTQLSYWPAYSGNHLPEASSFTDWLWATKPVSEQYTRQYFNAPGLNVPGVQTLTGMPMGGWIQYSCSPTVAAWLSQHFYWQWKYSMDTAFMRNRAYPWAKAVATFLEKLTLVNEQGYRQLPISSSPEIGDNDISAWFLQTTNYDLSLMKYVFSIAANLATSLQLKQEAAHWQKIASQLPGYALSPGKELMIAPGMPYAQSHRHFSHLMAIYPLGLIRWENGGEQQQIIRNSLQLLDSIGPRGWCGYSYSWLASLKARAKDGEGAAKALGIFAKAFCLPNSFHANGDQTKSGYSGFTYKPFTLEGNFAFAGGLQEMLLQSYAGFIAIFPAVPDSWKDLSFKQLRAEGAFLVSARRSGGQVEEINITAEKEGKVKVKLPFKTWYIHAATGAKSKYTGDGYLEIAFNKGGSITIKNGYE